MRKTLIVAGVAAAALIPSFAFAQISGQSQINCQSPVSAAVSGGAQGSTGRQIAGAVLGALLGGQQDCARAYGYYDANGQWHANAVDRTQASGYFDREGRWVEGAPNGYYDSNGRWISANASAQASGYYDHNGRWVPASAGGYYDANGRWVGPMASGYYDSNGRWVAGPATGRYDANGRWISGQAAGRMVNGVWVADAQPGYYDSNGRWVRGSAQGYYDAQGRWVSTGGSSYGDNSGYGNQGQGYNATWTWADAPSDLAGRISWLDRRIRAGVSDGSLRRGEGQRALQTLQTLRLQAQPVRTRRGMTIRNEASLRAQLDTLAAGLRWRNNVRAY